MPEQLQRLYTESQISELFQIPKSTLRKHRCMREGLPFLKIQGAIRYDMDQVRDYMTKNSRNAA